jgi:hypothetical protein
MISFYLSKDSGTTLYLDSVASVQTGLPERDFSLVNTLGEGAILSGIGNRTGREWSAEYNFRTEDQYERFNYLSFFNNNIYDDMYLYRKDTQRFKCNITAGSTACAYYGDSSLFDNLLSSGMSLEGVGISTSVIIDGISGQGTSTRVLYLSSAASLSITNTELQAQLFLGRTQVMASVTGGESYQNTAISESIGLKLWSESPFFSSTTLKTGATIVIATSESNIEKSFTINNLGQQVPPVVNFTLSSAATSVNSFQLKSSYGFGYKVQKQLNAAEVVQVDARESDLKLYVSGVLSPGYFTETSQPFTILQGANTFYVTGPESTGILVQYYERKV